jgi:hypothetical protein
MSEIKKAVNIRLYPDDIQYIKDNFDSIQYFVNVMVEKQRKSKGKSASKLAKIRKIINE